MNEYNISRFDNNHWVVKTHGGNHILIDENSRIFLEILKSAKDEGEALNRFNQSFEQSLTPTSFEKLIKEKFQNLDLLCKDDSSGFRKKSYLNLKVTIIHKKIAGYLAMPFIFLYTPLLFWTLFACSLLFIGLVGFTHFSIDLHRIKPSDLIVYSIFLYLSMLIHELGHIAACKKFNASHGEIGFGFYIIFPVLYANVSDIWTLKKHKRIIANLGGIYLELLFASILGCTFLLNGKNIFLYSSLVIFIKTLTELNPFIRYDGYWLISDITNTPNLLPRSNATVVSFFKKKLGGIANPIRNRRFYMLLLYGLANLIIITAYLVWIMFKYFDKILSFPNTIYSSLRNSLNGNFEFLLDLINIENLLIFGFYFLIARILLKLVIKKYKKNSNIAKLGLSGVDQTRRN